ncbi:MAG TPA: extracellular solute-binding protein [Alphaproteobacteria bacterium]|nr:extracellular solute-binding protein [Alphaproteobacteria bacterium]
MRLASAFAAALIAAAAGGAWAQDQKVTRSHALAEFGTPLYGPDTPHWPYANPNAPKGGTVKLGDIGTYDSLNTIITKGIWPRSLGIVDDSLMTGSGDEIGVVYGLIAEWAEYPEDKSWVRFKLRPEAKFQDGHPIRAVDFEYAWQTIRDHGRPFLKSFYESVQDCKAEDELTFRCDFTTRGLMKPLVTVAGFSPLPKHWWTSNGRDITKTTTEPPLGSSSYKVAAVDTGRSITYERVKDYWGENLWLNKGTGNFDRIVYEYYRDPDVMLQAFKGGQLDFRQENSARNWATQYDFDALKAGRAVKEALPDQSPKGAQGFFLNTRREVFKDPKVREALAYLFDFEWLRKNIMYNSYTRTRCWFPNSEYCASGLPQGRELEILEAYRGRVPERVFTTEYVPPKTDGSGNIRDNLRIALRLLKEAGWENKGGKLVNAKGEVFAFEILGDDPTDERVANPWIKTLSQAGIQAKLRIVDAAQYEERTKRFDFDVIQVLFTFFPPPGPELVSRFGSAAADIEDSANYFGMKDPVVDELLARIVKETDYDTLVATTRALDRVLQWGHYMVPQWYNEEARVAYWNRFSRPETLPKYGIGFPGTWWIDAEKDAKAGVTR